MTDKNIITIDEKDYDANELTQQANICIARIQDYDRKANALKLELTEMEMITKHYLEELRKEIKDAKPILQQDTKPEGDTKEKS